MRTKKRREQICNLILGSVAAGEAKLFQAGLDKPNENIQKYNSHVRRLNLFTSVVLKYHTSKTIDFTLEDKTLIHFFARLFKESDGVMITGDNTRTSIDVEKYRQVILEGRKEWLPNHEPHFL